MMKRKTLQLLTGALLCNHCRQESSKRKNKTKNAPISYSFYRMTTPHSHGAFTEVYWLRM